MSGERSPFGPRGIAGGPLTEVKPEPAAQPWRDLAQDQPTTQRPEYYPVQEETLALVKPSRFVLELRRHVEQRWPFWACRDAAEACGDDLDACVDWLKRAHPGTGPQAHQDARAFVGKL